MKKKAYIFLVATIISLVLGFVIKHVYEIEEAAAFQTLHMETRQIKEDINLQILSDRENLATMAQMIAKLYQNKEPYELMFGAFESIGLIRDIEILLPDNTLLTKNGGSDVSDNISYSDEVKKGAYVTGRVSYLLNEKEDIVRSAVPVIVENEPIAILYGVIDLNVLEERYADRVKELGAQLFVFEKENGKLIIDTFHDELGNISFLKSREYKGTFSYEKLQKDISINQSGYLSFASIELGEDLYIHYAPMAVGEWEIMLGLPESAVFSNANYVMNMLLAVSAAIIVVMVVYILLVLYDERRMASMNACVAKVRKLLLEINYREDSIPSALGHIAKYVRTSSVFLEDMVGDEYDYVLPGADVFLEDKKEKKYFITELYNYAKKMHPDHSVTIRTMEIICKKMQDDISPLFLEFLQAHDIEKISFVSIVDKNDHFTLLGAINPKKRTGAKRLMAELAVCFSIAIYNRRYILEIERVVSTDSLTGVMNRVAFKKDVMQIQKNKQGNLACIYIDVNELHLFNNRYGHTAGDSMLVYVAEAIKENFGNSHIYRMGGDEFLVIVKEAVEDEIQNRIDKLNEQLNEKKYYVSVGIAISDDVPSIENLLKEAERKMYKEKALYYLHKQKTNVLEIATESTKHIVTGMKELDTLLTIMGQKYRGIYSVSLKTDYAKRILMSSYLNFGEKETNFSYVFKEYVTVQVHPDYHRDMLILLDYDILAEYVVGEKKVEVVYKKIDGSMVVLTIYLVEDTAEDELETLWVFEEQA